MPISMLMMGEVRRTEPCDIEDHVLDYFQGIFGVDNFCTSNDLVSKVIPSLVTDHENLMLTAAPDIDEIKKAVFDLNGDDVRGPDDFGGHFFQDFWNIVASDVVSSVQDFFLFRCYYS